jgi:acetyltransferase-like isoleucine patch superfamily enzyme
MLEQGKSGSVAKATLKHILEVVALALVLVPYLLFLLGRIIIGPPKAFQGWSQSFSLLPGISGVYLRRAFYHLVFPRCDRGVWIGFGTVFSHETAALGRNVYTGSYCCLGDVTLEDDVLLGSQVSVINGGAQHGTTRLDIPIREQPGVFTRITIGQDSWIGERAIVLADIGKHCVVAAGSIVTKPLPDCAIAAGIPARVIRFRDGSPSTDRDPSTAAVESY